MISREDHALPSVSGSARALALELVRRVTDEGAFSNLLLTSLLERSGLSLRDRALATELSYGTLRRLITIDNVLSRHVQRPLQSAPPAAREPSTMRWL